MDAVKVYNLVYRQVIISGMGQVVDINQLAIWEVIDRYRIVNGIKVFEKVVSVSRHFLNKQDDSGEKKDG